LLDRLRNAASISSGLPLLVVALLAALAGGVGMTQAAGGDRHLGHCRSVRHAVGHSKQLVVSWDGDIKTCDRATGRVRHVGTDYPFGPPARAISVVGYLVGFAVDVEGDGDMPNYTFIRIADLRHHKRLEDGPLQRWGLIMGLPSISPVKIGSLAIDAHRRVAWIQCPEPDDRATGSARPNCVHPGDSDTVQLLPSARAIAGSNAIVDPVEIATGTDIDPRSVRLTPTNVIWTQGGHRHSRALRALTRTSVAAPNG
jgi:hypothetical protein